MKLFRNVLMLLVLCITLLNCSENKHQVQITTQKDYPAPPVAAVKPDTFTEFGNTRIDNYFWLKDRSNPAVMEYLKAENAYFDTVLAHTKGLQEKLYHEMRGRIKEEDQTVPMLENGYYYYKRTVKDKEYPIYCRKKGDLSAPEEVLFDVNTMAEGYDAFLFANYEVTMDNGMAAYMYNTTGSYADFNLKFRNLKTGEDLDFEIDKIQGFTWANDSKHIFYVIANQSLRPYRVYRHAVNAGTPDKMVYEEKDEQFNVFIYKSKTREFIYMASGSFTTSEYRYLPADNPLSEFKIFRPRQKDVEYFMEHHKDRIYIKYKDPQNINGKIYVTTKDNAGDMSGWKEVVKHDPEVKIQDFELFDKYLSLNIRKNGLNGISVLDLNTGKQEPILFPEPVYVVSPITTAEFNSVKCRYSYSSLNRPITIYDYDMVHNTSEKLKEQEIPGGFNPDDYTVARLWAPTSDSNKVPIALIHKKGLEKNGNNPTLLYGYGSYANNIDATFRSNLFSLVDRGFVFAIAQIRGGSEMGEQWYEEGKLMNKKNTFTDFIACAEYLIGEKYTSTEKLGIQGGSAGGLLMGAVANMRPDLFQVVLAEVPFVDLMNSMLDETLPLTTQEYEQWGNPNEEEAYRYMLSYSPYDNVTAQKYPNILATAGWNDSQVMYHEAAKWVARLRALKTNDNLVVLKTNLESGHGGATGRFDYLWEVAFKYAFLLDRMGLSHIASTKQK